MPKNLKNRFRTELIRQRRNARQFGGRDKLKKLHEGKYTDYSHIYSDRSYQAHLGRSRKFADFCQQNGVKTFEKVTPEFAKSYLISERNSGLSASTIGADALAINHIMIGGGFWKNSDRLVKSKITGMPKRSNKIYQQREKSLNSTEWRERYPSYYQKYQGQIDTIRAFGLRRRELVGGSSYHGKDGLGNNSLYWSKSGRIMAVTLGKGGKFRQIECRLDLQPKMQKLYGEYIRPTNEMPRNKAEYMRIMRTNKPFYGGYSHSIPSHIFRADYAQFKLRELASKSFSGSRVYSYSKRIKSPQSGKYHYVRTVKYHNLSKQYQIGIYKAPYGAFYKLSEYMGHNRLDVLQSYLGEGREN